MLVVNGINYEEEFDFIVTAIRGRGPVNQEINATEIANKKGSLYRGATRPPRILEVDGTLSASSPEALRTEIERMNGLLYSEKEREIYFTDDPVKKYYGINEQTSESEEEVSNKPITLVFYCSDPDKYGANKTNQTGTTITLNSTAKTPPIITATIQESTNSLSVVHQETGEEIVINYNLVAGNVVEIDCENNKVSIDGELQMNAIDLMKADFPSLVAGENNFTLTPASTTLSTDYIERWL
ncbi:distal tail protein Dit [Gracilibacillus suaedae]|uniref:distal tail protein Dit n=1 Tax=Gracilibacillus suaedae TaxID=2820273 RepID=UPI001ABEC8E9|nr:distal tail protein Dit [Gracilibacillus suaedae]